VWVAQEDKKIKQSTVKIFPFGIHLKILKFYNSKENVFPALRKLPMFPVKIVEKGDYCDHLGRTQWGINRAYEEVILRSRCHLPKHYSSTQ
jgi:hypothetical protein